VEFLTCITCRTWYLLCCAVVTLSHEGYAYVPALFTQLVKLISMHPSLCSSLCFAGVQTYLAQQKEKDRQEQAVMNELV
jgi:hypothetical protein